MLRIYFLQQWLGLQRDGFGLAAIHLVAPNARLLTMQQIGQHGCVMHVGRCRTHGMDQFGFAVHADMRLHAEIALLALAGLMHLGVAHFGRVLRSEADALSFIRNRVPRETEIVVDEAPSWNGLAARNPVKCISHQVAFSLDGACTNGAESFVSRLRRAEQGDHHHITGVYLGRYAQEGALGRGPSPGGQPRSGARRGRAGL